jgi:hypothetical protein
METSKEVDWVAAWYGVWNIWDSTIGFWMTATFAVIVATHALGNRATREVTRPLAILYATFSTYTILRGITISLESNRIAEEVSKPEIDMFSHLYSFPVG